MMEEFTHLGCIEPPARDRELLLFLAEYEVQLQLLRIQVLERVQILDEHRC